jgi:hypothetical protein
MSWESKSGVPEAADGISGRCAGCRQRALRFIKEFGREKPAPTA